MSTKLERERHGTWETIQNANVEVNRLAYALSQIDFEKEPERFGELTIAHTLAIEERRRAENAWYELIKKARK
jgi:hypothetical protein